jgi:tripartite ATP-independent transporter DctP family solute receptor
MLKKNIFLLIIIICFSYCSNSDKQKTIKLAHGLDTNHPVHKAMILMGSELEKNSNGKLKLEIYPNQQLGSERQCLELLQIGSLDMTKVSAAVMENFSPNMKVLGLPFLFENKEHTFKTLDGEIGQELLDGGKKYWLKGLGYYDAGSRSFYTKDKNITAPKDLEGLKIRVMESVTAMNMVSSLGGSPSPISSGELYTALQQGVVDGAENNPTTFFLSRHYEVCKFFSLDEHTTIPDVLIMSTHLWNSLSEQEQNWIQVSVKTSVKYQRELWEKSELNALKAVQKEGVVIIQPEKTQFKNKVEKIYESYKDNIEMYSLINRIKNNQ